MENYMSKKECGWINTTDNDKDVIFNYCDQYIDYLNNVKTEREAVKYIINILKSNGFNNINDMDTLNIGDKVYYINNNKTIYASIIGTDKLTNGINIIGSHIDSPRLDLKPSPLYESDKLALFKTHYYGGIKKYQWTTIPLSIHGVIYKSNGDKLDVNIGEDINDPIFTITDILPHLAREQYEKKIGKAIEAEDLNLIVGSIPNTDNKVKENIMKLLNEKYGIIEDDFYSSELEIVPAFKARSLGFDKSMVAGYGQDDRVCSYGNLNALIKSNVTNKTIVSIFADKEEIGSVGNTGMYSQIFELFLYDLLEKRGENKPGAINKLYANSYMLSADVGAGVDPNYSNAFEKNNASYIGYGVEINKYTGSGGKSGSSDANASFVYKIRNVFSKNNILFQFAELGKTDLGGGGTIAYILANKGINVIDCGIPVISMHSPYEVTSKFDVYESFKAYKSFFENIK